MGDGALWSAQWYCKACVSDITGKPFLNFARRTTCRECGKPKGVCAMQGGKAGGKCEGGGGKRSGGGGKGKGPTQAEAAKLYADQRAKEAKSAGLA